MIINFNFVFKKCSIVKIAFLFVLIILMINLSIKNKVLKKVLKLIDFKCK